MLSIKTQKHLLLSRRSPQRCLHVVICITRTDDSFLNICIANTVEHVVLRGESSRLYLKRSLNIGQHSCLAVLNFHDTIEKS